MKNQGGILSGPEILRYVQSGRIQVTPFEKRNLNPGSLDLTLGNKVSVYKDFTYCGAADVTPRSKGPYDGRGLHPADYGRVMDVRKPYPTREWTIDPVKGWVIMPGVGYLMHTAEKVLAKDTVPIVDGKSSLGRVFLQVHMTAGYGDAGFDGQYTLEVKSTFPVRVYPGMRICQIRFVSICGEVATYEGHYKGKTSEGAVPSMVHQQMSELED